MSAMLENRRTVSKAMPNYHLMDVDAASSQASLNIPEDNGKRYHAQQPGFLGINLRFLLLIISIIFFILSLIFFISTIVVYYSRPVESHNVLEQNKDTGSTKEIPVVPSITGGSEHANDNEDPTPTTPPFSPGFASDKWSATKVNGRHVRPGKLVFQEDFTSFNRSSWSHITGNSDNHFFFNVNNNSNSYVSNGKLFLKPTYSEDRFGKAYIENGTLLLGMTPSEKCLNSSIICWKGRHSIVHPIMAPMITSQNFFNFQYGKLQISAKMPSGDWIEPILSLQPETHYYGSDLYSGQIHFVDTRGNRKVFRENINIGSEQNCPDIRYGTSENKKVLYHCVNTEENDGFDRDFHLYELEWTPKSITLKIDGEGYVGGPYPRSSMFNMWSNGTKGVNPWAQAENSVMAPFDKSFYLTIGISVGGTTQFFSDDYEYKPYGKPWNNTDPNAAKRFWDARNLWEPTWENDESAMQIDFIRLYSLDETVPAEED